MTTYHMSQGKRFIALANAFVLSALLTACGGSNGSNDDNSGNTNTPPIVNAGPDQNVMEGTDVQLSGSGSDTEGAVTFAWTQTSGASVSLSSTSDTNPSFTAPQVDATTTLEFTLNVTDTDGESISDTVSITITDSASTNTPPTANAGADQSVNENQSVTLSGSGSDMEGSVIYLWSQTSGSLVIITNESAAMASFTAPDVDAETLLTFALTVTDQEGLSASDTIDITVMNMNTTGFNRRIKAMHFDLDNNGIDEGLKTYSYNADGTISTITYTYVDDGSPDAEFNSFSFGQVDEDETENYTYNANGDLKSYTSALAARSSEFVFDWLEMGKVNTLVANTYTIGALESSIEFSVTYSDDLLSSVLGDVVFPITANSTTTLDIVLTYDEAGVLRSDLLATTSGTLVQESQREYSWNANGAIENIREFNTDPNSTFEDNKTFIYANNRLVTLLSDNSVSGMYAWDLAYDADGLLASYSIDVGNDDMVEAKVVVEWEEASCQEVIFWGLRGFPAPDKRLSNTLPYTLGDGHFAIPVCGNAAP